MAKRQNRWGKNEESEEKSEDLEVHFSQEEEKTVEPKKPVPVSVEKKAKVSKKDYEQHPKFQKFKKGAN